MRHRSAGLVGRGRRSGGRRAGVAVGDTVTLLADMASMTAAGTKPARSPAWALVVGPFIHITVIGPGVVSPGVEPVPSLPVQWPMAIAESSGAKLSNHSQATPSPRSVEAMTLASTRRIQLGYVGDVMGALQALQQ